MTVGNEVISEELCSCGTEVRAGSAYCYHCGGKVAGDGLKSVNEDLGKRTQNGSYPAKVDGSIIDSTSVPRTNSKKTKRERKRVHVVWQQTDGPGYMFLLVAVGVAIVVLAVLAAAAYLQ